MTRQGGEQNLKFITQTLRTILTFLIPFVQKTCCSINFFLVLLWRDGESFGELEQLQSAEVLGLTNLVLICNGGHNFVPGTSLNQAG